MSSFRHSSSNASASKSAHPVQVYAPGFRYVLTIAARDVHHMPPANLNVTRLVLCANYNAGSHASCPMGDRCKFVHADTTRAQKQQIHVNYAWRSLEEVTYERFPEGDSLHVAAPNSKIAADVMDPDMVLKTRALESKRRPLSHCAHYYFNRTCNLGTDCQFIHAVFIDPNAKEHQRAPVPSQLGEGRELQLSKKQREARQRDSLEHVVTAQHDHHQHHHVQPVTHHAMPVIPPAAPTAAAAAGYHMSASVARFEESVAHAGASVCGRSSGSCTPRRDGSDFAHASDDECITHTEDVSPVASQASSPSAGVKSLSRSRAPRFRHDPYSMLSSRVVSFPHVSARVA